MAGDGAKVGQAYIEVTTQLRIDKAEKELKKHLKGMAREIDREFNRSQKEVVGGFNRKMRMFQQGATKALFAEQRAEMEAFQKLQKQKMSALKVEETKRLKAFETEKRRIADSMKAQKSLSEQRTAALAAQQKAAEVMGKAEHEAYSMERKRILDIQKAEMQAYREKRKREDAITKAQIQAHGLERKRIEAIQKAEIQAYAERTKQESILAKKNAYIQARTAGLNTHQSAQYATGALGAVNPGATAKQLRQMAAAATASGFTAAKAFDVMSHHLSQLSTRIGLASFQLQLLGGFATTFLTGPAAFALGALARDGLKFAVSIDYARASMQSLLGPSTNVEKILADIRKMAIESPLFNTEDAISYAQKLAAVGVKGKDLYKSMQALSNIFLTQGVAGPERANLALMAYTQILSKGTIGMDDLRQQFAEHVPGGMKVFEQAAHILGFKTLEDLRDSMKAGKTSAAELNEAFIKLGNTPKYLQGATKASETLGGVWQAFTENVQATLGMAFDKHRKEIIAAINAITPVVMGLINEFVAALPKLIDWLGRLIVKIRNIWYTYQALNPQQKEAVRQVILLSLAAGPAAIAIGIFGTALSGVANGASLAAKALALMGTATTAAGGWIMFGVASIGAIIAALTVLYRRSEEARLAILQALNGIKDAFVDILLPAIDKAWGAIQSLEKTFAFLGFESKDLAQVLRVLSLVFYALTLPLFAVVAVVKVVQGVVLVLSALFYGLMKTVSFLILGFQKLAEAAAFFATGDRKKAFQGLAEDMKGWRDAVGGLGDKVDLGQQWQGLTETTSNVTGDLQEKLNGMDLTVTGLGGLFGNWNGILDQTINKQVSLRDAVDKARQAMQSQSSAAMSAQNAADGYDKSVIALRDSIDQNGRSLNRHSRQGQANRDMLKAATQASYEMMLQDIASGVPMDKAIERHKNRTKALKDEFGKNKETRAEAQKLIDTYGKVPKDVKTLLETMGFTDVAGQITQILAAQKVAANPGMNYNKALANERKAWAFEKREGLKNGGVGKKDGGIIRGPGGPRADKIPIMASDSEYMIKARSAQKLGKPFLDYLNTYGEMPVGGQFAQGGQVKWPVKFDLSKSKIPEILGGSANGGGMGWAQMMAVLHQRFPGLPMLSGYRPGAMTSTGNQSYHAVGRAVDLPPSWDVFNWISQNYGKSTKELIFTPAGGRQIKNGQFHRFSGGSIEQDHYNHVHWAYDNGGQIAPNTPFINKTGANELALNSAQGKALQQKIENSDRPINVSVYVDGVKRDAKVVFDEMSEELIRALGGV